MTLTPNLDVLGVVLASELDQGFDDGPIQPRIIGRQAPEATVVRRRHEFFPEDGNPKKIFLTILERTLFALPIFLLGS